MSQHGEAAEQIVNMATNVTVKGVECLTNLAGRGALSLATFLIAALKDEKRTSGKARMRAFNGKPTKVFYQHQKPVEKETVQPEIVQPAAATNDVARVLELLNKSPELTSQLLQLLSGMGTQETACAASAD